MPRLAKADVHNALVRAASHIKDAAQPDGIASRKDIANKLARLEGTERALVDVFYRFIDHRDAGPGARITATDIDQAITYAKDEMIDAYDLNQNGLSLAEIAEMSMTGQLAAKLARELKGATPQGRGPAALSDALKKAITDGYCTVTWKDGNIVAARVNANWQNQGLQPMGQLEEILALPEVRNIEELKIGLIAEDSSEPYDPAMALIEQAGPFAKLKSVKVGDYDYPNEMEISWTTIGDIGRILRAAPNLESLHACGGGIELGPVEHQSLKSLTLETGGLPGSTVSHLGGLKLPSLEKLEVWFGADEYGSGGNAGMLSGLLAGTNLPKLQSLGLKNGEFHDELARALVDAPILVQLESLDLSMGTLTDEGAQTILDHAGAFAHLRALDLTENFVSAAMGDRFVATLPNAEIGEPKESWGDPGDYNYFYVSVGE